ncbi:MAG: hypothetical protein KY475_21240 [Planctomycetes bacterium]|nr:hypothetical protein [Planctomycetota bacterium]
MPISGKTTSLSACQRVAELWDQVVADFLRGEATTVRPPLDRWFRAYSGRGRGAVDLRCFPEPYLGDILGSPRAAILALNPGASAPSFQAPDGVFANEIRIMGSYRKWAKSWAYLREPWGYNGHHQRRMSFLRRWFGDNDFQPDERIDFELYPWHSGKITGAMRPEAGIIRDFVWEPLRELGVEYIFAFGRPWLNLLSELPEIKVVDRIGDGGRSYATSMKPGSRIAVVKANTPSGAWLIIEKHSGSAGPPGGPEIEIIKRELGFD